MYLFSFFFLIQELPTRNPSRAASNSSRILLPSTSLTKFWPQKLMNEKKMRSAPSSSFRCILSLGFFNFSGRNFVSGEKSAEFFMNSIQNSAHKNSWLHLMFSFLSSYRSYRLESRQRQQFYVGLVFLFWNSLAQPHFGDCQWNSGRPSSHRSARLPLRHLPPKSKLLTLNS